MPQEQDTRESILTIIIVIVVMGVVSVGPIYYLFHLDEKRAVEAAEKKTAELEQQKREADRSARLAQTRESVAIPIPATTTPVKYSSTQYHFEFMNPGWDLSEHIDSKNNHIEMIWRHPTLNNNYLMFLPKSNYEHAPILAGGPVTTNEKIGTKNAVVKTWQSYGKIHKRYYITDPISGWTQCDQQLTNARYCGKIEYYNANYPGNLQDVVDSIQFK